MNILLKIFCKYGSYIFAIYMLLCLNIGLLYYALPCVLIVFGFAVIAVFSIYLLCKKRIPQFDNNSFRLICSAVILSTFIIELIIANCYPFQWASDPIICKGQAIYMAESWKLKPETSGYFYDYPNNVNLIIILGWLYRLFENYSYVIAIFLILVNLSSLFACLTVRNITNNNFVSIITLIVLQLFAISTTRTYMPYTSNLTILFPILTVYLYTSNFNTITKILLIPLVAAIGYQAKLTCLISFIALVFIEIIRYLTNRGSYSNKGILLSILSVIVSFGLLSGIKNYAWNSIGYQQDENRARDFAYFIFLGHNTNSGGQWDAEYVKLGEMKGTKTERDSFFYSVTKKNIQDRGIVGNIKFYISKTVISWGCTKMDYIQLNKGFDKFIYTLRLCIWYIVLTLAMLSVFFVRNRYTSMMLLTSVGVVLYLWLSECSFTYVIMFTPMVFALAGIGSYFVFKKQK